jgi:dienelactone hydrolase
MLTRRTCLSALAALPAASAADINEEIRGLAEAAQLRMQFRGKTGRECREWQKQFRAVLDRLLGGYRAPAQWNTVREKTVEMADHTRDELVLEAPGLRPLPVYVLTPKGGTPGSRPGVLALHGHGPTGYDAVAGVAGTPEAEKEIEDLRYDYGVQFARRGYVVAVPCFTPFGRRLGDSKLYKGHDACGITYLRMQMLGKLLIAENLRDSLWAFEVLARNPAVDTRRLACAGLSYGGRMTMLTTAVEPRIRAAVISGALNMLQERILGRYSCGAQVIPGLLEYGDVPEITSLIAPRPVLFEVGNRDSLMVKDRIPPALEKIHRAYTALGARDRVELDEFDGTHQWHGARAYPFLERFVIGAAGS